MSSIPYNYGSYIDAKVAMTDTGHVSAGKQIQSPASAGSRGLAKTTQFTNDRTQMQMGNSPIAESMVEIRNILNRIDGVNAPVQEDAGDQALANDIAKIYDDVVAYLQDVSDNPADDEGDLRSGYDGDDVNDAEDLAAAFRKDFKTGMALQKQLQADREKEGVRRIDVWDPFNPESKHYNQLKALMSNHKGESVAEDEDELARLKELSGMEAPKESEKAVSEDIGDKGRIALEKAGFDPMKVKEYMAVFNDHGDTSDIDQMNMDKVGLADAMAMVLASHDVENESYQPMPEGDEFDIEEDEDFEEVLGPLGFPEDETELFDAEYQGRKVPLNKPMRGDTKKFKVYVKDPKTGNVKKVNFGHGGTSAKRKTMRIRKSNPKARKSFRARHNCANPGPKTKARYWSCRKW